MKLLDDKRVWIAGGALLGVLVLALGWLMFISPKMSDTKRLRSDASAAEFGNTTLAGRVSSLRKQNDQIDDLKQQLADEVEAMPPGVGLSDYTRQVSKQASASGVVVSSLTIAEPTPVTSAGAATTTTPATTGSTASGQAYEFAITLSTQGTYQAQLGFLRTLQHEGPRVGLITQTQFSSSGQNGSIDESCKLTTQLVIFTSPMTPAQAARLGELLSGSSATR
jgi:hypothetical protein